MRESIHIITFLKRVKKFSQEEGITSTLKVDKDNSVADVLDPAQTTGALIADIDNNLYYIIDQLREYYIATNNKKLLKRLDELR